METRAGNFYWRGLKWHGNICILNMCTCIHTHMHLYAHKYTNILKCIFFDANWKQNIRWQVLAKPLHGWSWWMAHFLLFMTNVIRQCMDVNSTRCCNSKTVSPGKRSLRSDKGRSHNTVQNCPVSISASKGKICRTWHSYITWPSQVQTRLHKRK